MKIFFEKTAIKLIDAFHRSVIMSMEYLPFIKLYQPIYGKTANKKLTRACIDRWEAVRNHLPEEKGSVLDIGCNIGYFSFKFCEEGYYAYGVDHHRYNTLFSSSIKHYNKIDNAIFFRHFVDLQFLKTMPQFKVVVNLSVFHHWVKQYGQHQAIEMMAVIADKCECLVFETGQSNEYGSQWPEVLSFMGDQPEAWVKDFLVQIGFKTVINLGAFPTDLTLTKRTLFIAKK